MMKTRQIQWVATVVVAVATTTAQGAAPTLSIGDAAPQLQCAQWVQGEPVKAFAPDKVYLVEFWATWCGPCRVSIPRVNDLHHKFQNQGLVVIGQDCWERDESKVRPFVKSMGQKMSYRVALDTKNHTADRGRMAETWMQAAGRTGIPSAFLVDRQGRIAWIGHPMALKEEVIGQVLAGHWDLKKAAADYQEQERQAATRKAAAKKKK